MSRNVSIVGAAARTPVGLTAEATAAAIRGGITRVGEHTFMVDADGDPLMCGAYPKIAPELLGIDRIAMLLCDALIDLAARLRPVLGTLPHVPLLLALPEPRPGFEAGSDKFIAREIARRAPFGSTRLDIRVIGRGHAGALLGLRQAVTELGEGTCELCLVAGGDSYFQADTLDWLDADLRIARASSRGGFPPGEAAAVLAVASEQVRRGLRAPALAVVRSVACLQEPRNETAPEGLQGEGLTQAYRQVAAYLDRPRERVDQLYCDINDERARTTDLGFALLRVGDMFRDGTAYVTPVGQIGDVGAATFPLNCILATQSWARGYAPGPTALISGASWGGLRGAALLHQGD